MREDKEGENMMMDDREGNDREASWEKVAERDCTFKVERMKCRK